jgi:hypothetical protein
MGSITTCVVFSLEEVLELELLDRLDSEDLCELRKYFFPGETQVRKKMAHRKRSRYKKTRPEEGRGQRFGGQPLTKKQFVKAVEKVVGKCRS